MVALAFYASGLIGNPRTQEYNLQPVTGPSPGDLGWLAASGLATAVVVWGAVRVFRRAQSDNRALGFMVGWALPFGLASIVAALLFLLNALLVRGPA
ncbi:MAG TPA: hypothetical protein VGK67_35985 [Myxococcales bacterium]